ncbi:hypothetical protein EPO44_09955 [bacterium]|nr:MAG: hypothetical protein EPO44_09955 [bacterium]
MTKIRFSRLSMVVGVLTAAVLFQGCLLADKIIADFYPAVFRIPDGVEQKLTSTTFFIPGLGYCNNTFGSIFFSGNIFQSDPLPTELYIKHTHQDELGNIKRVAGVNAMVDAKTGEFQGSSMNVIDPGCFEQGDKLEVSVQPNGGDIAEGAQLSTLLRYAF